MDETIKLLGALGFGGFLGIVIKHFLDKGSLSQEREYQFLKSNLLRHQEIGQKIIEKLLMMDNHRDNFHSYLQACADEISNPRTILVEVDDFLNKEEFEKQQGEIVALVFIYFNALGSEWNKCISLTGNMYNIAHTVRLIRTEKHMRSDVQYKETIYRHIAEYNKLNEKLGDAPKDLSKKILGTIQLMEAKLKLK